MMEGDSAVSLEPRYKRYSGKLCDTCKRTIVVTIRYDKRANDGVEEYSYLSARCACGMIIFYRNGSWSYIPKKDFDKNKMLVDDLKQSGFDVKLHDARPSV
jgi:RNase P subunit RPR2